MDTVTENTETPELSQQQRRDKSNANLKMFKPGQSGNPGGRPKGSVSPTNELIKLLEENPTRARDMAQRLLDNACKGIDTLPYFKEVANRIDGKVTDKLEVKGHLVITPDMRALAARELTETKEDEAKLLKEGNNGNEEG